MKKNEFQPGFKMSVKQYFTFWRFWREAMEAQGWVGLSKAEQDGKRYEMLGRAGFKSLKEVDHRKGFDAVLVQLDLLRERIPETAEERERRRFLRRIGEQFAELTDLGAAAALATVMRERFKLVAGLRGVEDLETEELRRCVMTLDRLVSTEKEGARDEHDQGKVMDIEEDLACAAGGHEAGECPF